MCKCARHLSGLPFTARVWEHHSFRRLSKLSVHRHSFASTMIPTGASAAVLKPSDPISDDAISVQGPNFDNALSFAELMKSYERIGFQASSFGTAVSIVNKMVCDYIQRLADIDSYS